MDETEWSDWSDLNERWYEEAELQSQNEAKTSNMQIGQWHDSDSIDAVVQYELNYERMLENAFTSIQDTQKTHNHIC